MKLHQHQLTRTAVILGVFLALALGGLWLVVEPAPDPVHAGKRASEWLREVGCGDPLREQQATNAFVALGTNALPVLKAALNRRDSSIRGWLMNLELQFPSLPWNFFASSARSWHTEALDAATILGTNARPLLPELAEALGECGGEQTHVEFIAGFNLAAVKPLTDALKDTGNTWGMRALLESLALILRSNKLSAVDEELVTATLTTVLQNNWDEFVDREAAYAIGHFGAKAERAIPVLLDCLANRESKSSYPAAWALGQINRQPKVVLPALVQATDKEHFGTVRAEAARAMGHFGTNAAYLTPLLLKLSADRDSEVRGAALSALVELAPASSRTTAAVIRQIHDRNSYLRRQAVKASVLLTGHPRRLVAALEKSLQDKDEEVRHEAAAALQVIRTRELSLRDAGSAGKQN